MKSIEELTVEALENNIIPTSTEIDSAVTDLIQGIAMDDVYFPENAEDAGCDTYESHARYCMELDDEYNALLFDSAAKLWAWVEDGCSAFFQEFAYNWTSSF